MSDEDTQRQARSAAARSGGSSGGRVANSLVAIGSASVLAIYAAGYWRTRAAAERIERASARHAAPMEAPVRPLKTPEVVAPAAAPESKATTNLVRADAPVRPATAVAAVPKAAAPAQDAAKRSAMVATAATKPTAPVETEAIAQPQTPSSVTAPASAMPVESDASASPVPVPAPTIAATDAVAKAGAYKDGTYTGWGTCRHGDIQATVVVAAGRITSATISQCLTRYPCSWIEALPPQVVQRQSAEVDYVSGATQSADAFYGAVTDALSKAK